MTRHARDTYDNALRQEHLTAQLNGQKLEKTLQKLRHELAKSRAMNDLLQNEVRGYSVLDIPVHENRSVWSCW